MFCTPEFKIAFKEFKGYEVFFSCPGSIFPLWICLVIWCVYEVLAFDVAGKPHYSSLNPVS